MRYACGPKSTNGANAECSSNIWYQSTLPLISGMPYFVPSSEPRAKSGARDGISGGRFMHIARRFTTAGRDPYEAVAFRAASSEIRNPHGAVVLAAEGIEVPAEWSQVACASLAQQYRRKAGRPARVAPVEDEGVPPWRWR